MRWKRGKHRFNGRRRRATEEDITFLDLGVYVFCHLYEWLNSEDEDQESEDSSPKTYKHYQSNYLDSFLFLFVFSTFYHAGYTFIASWIPIIQPFWWMVNGHIGMVYFVLAKIGWVDFGPIINLMIPAITGIGYGAGLAHLVFPPDPAICLTTILAYLQMRKGKCNTSEDCCLTVVCTSLVAHILTGSWRGWLNDTYFLLTAVYTISALIPILLGPNCFVTFQQIAVPGIPILARNLVFGVYGQEFPVWAVN